MISERVLWGLGWLVVVLIASVVAVEIRKPRTRLLKELRAGGLWVLCGTTLGVGIACWAWMTNRLATENVTTAILAGSVIGLIGCVAHAISGLLAGYPPDIVVIRRGKDAKPTRPPKSTGVADREIDGAP